VVAPPDTFSIITIRSRVRAICSPSTRAMTSVLPPADAGTISVTREVAGCAAAGRASVVTSEAQLATTCTDRRAHRIQHRPRAAIRVSNIVQLPLAGLRRTVQRRIQDATICGMRRASLFIAAICCRGDWYAPTPSPASPYPFLLRIRPSCNRLRKVCYLHGCHGWRRTKVEVSPRQT
jgi:hypothetical protein